MLDLKQVRAIKKRFEGSTYRYPVQDVIDTCEAALKVVAAAQYVDAYADKHCDRSSEMVALKVTLEPFTAKTGDR